MDFQRLTCFPIEHVQGDKIIIPSSILDTLMSMDIQFPFIFEIITNDKKTNCGVLEFTAEEGSCFIPRWIMQNLNIKNGDKIYIRNVYLNTASFIKFKPDLKFLDISDSRAVLEYILRSFTCVTIGDKLNFEYNSKQYILEIMDVKPKKSCCIIDADIEVEFDEPDGLIPLSLPLIPLPMKAIDSNETTKSSESNSLSNSSTKWGKTSKIAHFQGNGNKLFTSKNS